MGTNDTLAMETSLFTHQQIEFAVSQAEAGVETEQVTPGTADSKSVV